ncbi:MULTISPECIES: gamma-glutamylcyclotransferase family protein [Marinomonas]|uniref:gamma-glutamylcyclotransferase family protein n=1 Tax=Marinomonas TaxID=28253 RepID=UPI0010552CB0|nr:gamma-glutamylcyclotransferase family protein [Marinomonas flavescens]
MNHLVFVFGTLKEGFPNFERNKGKRVLGTFRTVHAYPLLLVGKRYSPWLVLKQGEGSPVVGQVFSLDDAGLAEMDELERITQSDGYQRLEMNVVNLENGLEKTVFAYGKPVESTSNADIQMTLNGEYLLEHAALYARRR